MNASSDSEVVFRIFFIIIMFSLLSAFKPYFGGQTQSTLFKIRNYNQKPKCESVITCKVKAASETLKAMNNYTESCVSKSILK